MLSGDRASTAFWDSYCPSCQVLCLALARALRPDLALMWGLMLGIVWPQSRRVKLPGKLNISFGLRGFGLQPKPLSGLALGYGVQ